MNSVVVHYQEIALKGRNRPWFIARLVRNIRTATSGSGRDARRHEDGAHRDHARRAGGVGARGRSAAPCVRHREFFARRARAARRRRHRDTPSFDDLGDVRVSTFRVSAKRADKRFPLTSPQIEREVGGRIKEANGWTVNLDNPELTIHVEALTGEAFYYFGKERRPGRHADGRQRTRRRAAFGRHRFAGGVLSADEARVPRHPGALSQLSDPVACIAGESARAGGGADAVSAVHASVHGCVRRNSAAGDAGRAAAAACGDLPAADAADRAGDCRAGRMPARW